MSCINTLFYNTLRPRPLLAKRKKTFTSAGGQKLEYRGTCPLPIKIEDKEMTHEVHVITNLNEKVILGIDFISRNGLTYATDTREFGWLHIPQPKWKRGFISVIQQTVLPPLTASFVSVNISDEQHIRLPSAEVCISTICSPSHPLLMGGPDLVQTDLHPTRIKLINSSPFEIELRRDEQI